ncbi:MAG: YkgJ family cysteine cluster protein [Gemmatales bacterium]
MPSPASSTVRPRIALRILGEEIAAQAEVPAHTGTLDQLLPLMLTLDSAAIDVAVRRNPSGQAVSCAKGCSACCRAQPVPITPPEAYALWRIVEAMPEVRREEVLTIFAEREAQLEEAGLRDIFLREKPLTNAEHAKQAVAAYVQLKLACPFLVDDACSIHPQRPFVCRQYLVTSDPALCNDPLHEPVEVVPMPLQPAHAMLSVTDKFLGLTTGTIPLVLAMAYVARHRNTLEKQVNMKDALQHWMQQLAG